MNKTSICSIVVLEIIDFSKKTEADQADIKNQLNSLINHAVIDIPQTDRVIVEKEHGAVITFNGASEDALEDALFISLTLRDEILKNNTHSLKPWYVQFSINLGAVRVAKRKGLPDLIGEGVDEARRIMSFANPNQILVSRVYYEMVSNLTQEISNMFEQYDMHAHEQEIYAVHLKQTSQNESATDFADGLAQTKWQPWAGKTNWKYAGIGLLAFAAIFVMGKRILMPIEPTITMDPPVVAEIVTKPEAKPLDKPVQALAPVEVTKPTVEIVQEASNKAQKEPVKVVQKKVTQKPVVEAKVATSNAEKSVENNTEKPVASATKNHSHVTAEAKMTESKAEKNVAHEKSGWESFKNSVKQGTERPCSQAESAMGQCTK